METSDSEDERGLKSLFKTRSECDEVFYFSDIVILPGEIVFKFRFCDDAFFESRVSLSENAELGTEHMRTCFSIGMCVCAWYWMGYYTDSIIIEESVCAKCHLCPGMVPFWDELYKQIALEFAFVNKTPLKLVHFKLGGFVTASSPWVSTGAQREKSGAYGALIPMGGGKDSLVVWHQYQQSVKTTAAAPPLLLYVADGMEEYSSSARLQKLVAMTGNDLRLVRHDFQTQLLHRRKRSFLKPCAHPWAALVFFDSLLVAQLEGIEEVRLGYERSADEGNGVFVQGLEVNHQFDKSSAFLRAAQEYALLHLTPSGIDASSSGTEVAETRKGVRVVSTLHGLWEIQIARIFCEAPELRAYLPVFLSCNDPTERGDWCRRCEKCAFLFLLLCAWLPPTEVVERVFGGEDMLRQEGVQRVLFRRLLGLEEGGKPLDCVGTVAEASAAVHLTAVRYIEAAAQGGPPVPALLTELCAELDIDCCNTDTVGTDTPCSCDSPAIVRTVDDDIMVRWAVDK